MSGYRDIALTCAIALLTACATTTTRPASTRPGRSAPRALRALVRDIDAILAQPALQHGSWGVLVKSLGNDDPLYAMNAGKLLLPASTMKIVTLAVAAETLGWDYRYDTTVRTAGSIEAGVLQGDLLVSGSGDPGLVAADGMADRVFAEWADRLKQRGIRTIAGRIIGDDNRFEEEMLGAGWMWDDLPDDYAAGVGALQFNESAVRLTIAPGPAPGDSAAISIAPAGSGLTVVNAVATGRAGGSASIGMRRLPGSATLEVRGSIPQGAAPSTLDASVDNPTLFFAGALRLALIANGIDVRGPAVDIDDVPDAPPPAGDPLASYRSAPLATLAARLMKASQNQYAETFLKSVSGGTGVRSTAGGRLAVQTTLAGWGIPAAELILRDGSGLSRYDFVTPAALVAILAHVDRDARLREPFEATLPIAGRDGTLSTRMLGTPAEGNARAKTGSMTGVRAMAGFVTTAGGERLAFAIVANNFETPADVVNAATDKIVVALATFRR